MLTAKPISVSSAPMPDDLGSPAKAREQERLLQVMVDGIAQAGGWWSFERFMQCALYEPELGYYASGRRIFGRMPNDGSDFVTAPELSPLFGRVLAQPLEQAFTAGVPRRVWEFGAGSGVLANTLLEAFDRSGHPIERYAIVDVSGTLKAQQAACLARFGDRVQWLTSLPEHFDGVVLGNEVLDAMPVRRLRFDGLRWWEQGVEVKDGALVEGDRASTERPPVDAEAVFEVGTLTETHAQAEAFIATVARRLGERSLALFIDYGFPAAEYYHPQRTQGTLMCHRAHQSDAEPLVDVGSKDITAHVNFTGIAMAAQEGGAEVYGYTSQGRFLLNAGMAAMLAQSDLKQQNAALRLVNEHEMGELFKVLAFGRGLADVDWLAFANGDRTHRL